MEEVQCLEVITCSLINDEKKKVNKLKSITLLKLSEC